MKLTMILLTAAALQVSAKGNSQTVTFAGKDVPLEQVFSVIKQQTGYVVAYDYGMLNGAKPVSLSAKDMPLQDFLNQALHGQSLDFIIKKKTIFIKKLTVTDKNNTTAVVGSSDRQPPKLIDVKGRVVNENGNPLEAVSVSVKGISTTVLTNSNGEFLIKGIEDSVTLIFTSVNMEPFELKVKGRTFLDVALQTKITSMQEVVISKGYYTTSKRLNTGNVSTVKGADISRQPVSDPLMALEGRIPGLYINQTSGVPGAGLKVSLRGRNSIANGTDPLYIIDGIPFNSARLNQNPNAADRSNNGMSPFHNIRPEDIESIEIFKDADATAIYGSRGANGVILITTKKGKSGRTKVDVNVNSGIAKVTKLLPFMNTQQYLEMRQEAFKNDNTSPGVTDYDVNGTWDKNAYTDWQKLMIGGSGHITNASATISGGNAQTQFLLGSSYRKETTVFPGDYSNKIGSVNLSVRHTSENQRFKADVSVNYAYNNNCLPTRDLTTFITLAPNTPNLYKPSGVLNYENGSFDNPLKLLNQKSTSISENLISNLNLSYSIWKGLQVKAGMGYTSTGMKEVNLSPLTSFNPFTVNAATARTLILGNNQRKSWIIEPQLNYSIRFHAHSIEAVVGTTIQQSLQEGTRLTGTGFSNDQLMENITAAPSVSTSMNSTTYKYNAIYARVGYNYDEKYIMNLTGRRDGSSRFGPGKQFGNFGAIGTAWIFSKEKFAKELLPVLSYGKLRASLGVTGNDQLTDYAFLSTYVANANVYLGGTTLGPLGLSNPLYGWETIRKQEIGLDLGFLDDRISLNASVFRNLTENQLLPYALPAITGFSSIFANLPAVVENTGLELELNTVNIKKGNFSWTSNFNITFPKNKLVSYPNIESSSYNQVYVVGQPLFVQHVYKYISVNAQSGLYEFEDLNKDGVITYLDKYPVFTGQKFYGGFNNSITYKRISLDVFFQFVKQSGFNAVMNVSPGAFGGGLLNESVEILDRWKSVNEPGTYQKYTAAFSTAYNQNQLYYASDAKITDASFARLKNVQLSWQIPSQWQKKLKIQSLRLYVQGQNLLTLTNFKGSDPESSQYQLGKVLPPLKVFTAGIQMSL